MSTFNVNGREPPEDLSQWILTNQSDLYVIGFQELQLDKDAFTGTDYIILVLLNHDSVYPDIWK